MKIIYGAVAPAHLRNDVRLSTVIEDANIRVADLLKTNECTAGVSIRNARTEWVHDKCVEIGSGLRAPNDDAAAVRRHGRLRYRCAALWLSVCLATPSISHAAEHLKQAPTDYPSRPIRIILPLSAGGSADAIARMVGDTFASAFGQSVVVDNRPGANGIIGMELVAKAAPDGYTLLVASGANLTVNPALHASNLPFDVEHDLMPLVHVASQTFIAHVSPAFPAKSIKELIAYAKAKPGAVNYASAGTGSTAHLMAALFESMTGVRMTHVPYKGAAQGRTAVMAREVDLMFDGLLATLPLIKAGRLRGLGVTSAKRSQVAPDIPTIGEAGVPGYDADAWYGLLAPRGTPAAVTTKLATTLAKALETPAVREKLLAQGVEPAGGTPQQFRTKVKSEMTRWGKMIKENGIRQD